MRKWLSLTVVIGMGLGLIQAQAQDKAAAPAAGEPVKTAVEAAAPVAPAAPVAAPAPAPEAPVAAPVPAAPAAPAAPAPAPEAPVAAPVPAAPAAPAAPAPAVVAPAPAAPVVAPAPAPEVPAVAAKAPAAPEAKSAFRYGLDERIRQEYGKYIPVRSGAYLRNSKVNDYYRFRTRIWSELDLVKDITVRVRAINESRNWNQPDVSAYTQAKSSEWLDEIVFDNIYLDIRNVGSLDIRLGRQELSYGNGRVILDGTAGDGSRTTYMNALLVRSKAITDVNVDLFAMYIPSEDDLAIDPAEGRNLMNVPSIENDTDESGAGVYVTSKANPKLLWDAYGIYKNEGDWYEAGKTNKDGTAKPATFPWEVLGGTSAKPVYYSPELDLGTVGFRVVPTLGDLTKVSVEAAYQLGDRDGQDVSGYMVDAWLSQQIMRAEAKPTLSAGVYALSGDDPTTADDEGWNPLWAHWPQDSELYVYSYDGARWSNLMMPGLRFSIAKPCPYVTKIAACVAQMSAMEDDGPGTGKDRGLLGTIRADLAFAKGKAGTLGGHVLAEVLDPGNYYTSDETAYFLRWQLDYAF